MMDTAPLATKWMRKTIRQLGSIYSGSTPSTRAHEYWGGDIVWITPDDLSGLRTRFVTSSTRKITQLGLKNCSATSLPPNSLIVSSRAPIGYLALSTTWFCTNQGCKTIVFHPDQDPEFHYYNLLFRMQSIREKGNGTTFAEISKTDLAKIEVPVPVEKREQSAIATVLSAVDRAIEQTEALIAKYQRIKTGLMHDLLTRGIDENGNLRDPARHRFKDSPLGRIPEEWDYCALDDLVDPIRPIVYGILMPGYGCDGGVPVVKVKDIVDGEIQTFDLLLTNPRIDEEYRRSRLWPGDLLFTIRGTVGRMAFVPTALEGANITQDTARVGIIKANPRFVRYYLDMPEPRRFIDLNTIGQAVRGINLSDVRRIPIARPPVPEQEKVMEILDTYTTFIRDESNVNAKLHRLKAGLMRDLLTGKVSVEPLLS